MKRTKVKRIYEHHGRYVYVQDLQERSKTTGKPKQKHHGLTRVSEGETAMLKALAELFEKLNSPERVSSMVKLVSEWQTNKEFGLPKYREETQKEYLRMSEKFKTEFEDFEVSQILPSDIAGFIDDNFADKANAANKYKQLASLIFAFGMRKGYCASNPCQGLQNYTENKGRERYITDDELMWLRNGLLIGDDGKPTQTGEMIVCFVDLALITGQRTSDILSLRRDEIQEKGIIFQPSKVKDSTGVMVAISMTPQLKDVINRAKSIVYHQDKEKKVTHQKGPYLLHTVEGEKYDRSGTYTAWRRGLERARKRYLKHCEQKGITHQEGFLAGMTVHDLRHRSLTEAEKQGRDSQKLGGHSDKKMTERYINNPDVEWIQPPVIRGI